MLNSGTESYAVVDQNTIEFIGNTNLIAWQNGTYTHDQNTNNLLSGDNEMYAGGRCTSSCTAPTYITSTGNTLNTYLAFSPPGDYPIDNATNIWSGPATSGITTIGRCRRERHGELPPTTATTGCRPLPANPPRLRFRQPHGLPKRHQPLQMNIAPNSR